MYLARKDISNKLMIFGCDRKKQQNSAFQLKKVMSGKNTWEEGGYNTGEEGGGGRHFLIGNDKNNVIADKVLSYFTV